MNISKESVNKINRMMKLHNDLGKWQIQVAYWSMDIGVWKLDEDEDGDRDSLIIRLHSIDNVIPYIRGSMAWLHGEIMNVSKLSIVQESAARWEIIERQERLEYYNGSNETYTEYFNELIDVFDTERKAEMFIRGAIDAEFHNN